MTSIRARYAALVAANLASGAFGFASASLVAWQFGPAGLGATALAASIVTYATTITTCGTEIYAVRTGAAGRHELGELATSVILIRLCLAAVVYAGIVGLTFAVPQFRDIQVLVWLFGLSVFTIAFDISWVPQAIHRTNAVAVATLSTQGLAFAFLAGSLAFSSDVRAVPVARIVAEACVAVGFLLWMRSYVAPLAAAMPARELWQFLQASAPVGGTQLLRGLALGSDLILLGLFVDAEPLGLYAGAFKVFQLVLGLAAAYFIILLPRIAERSHDNTALAVELRTSFQRALPPAVLALSLMAAAAGPLLRMIFGAEFVGAASSLRLLSLALLVNISLRHYRQVLLARGLQRMDLRNSVVGGLVHVGAKVVLIPAMGIVGAAVGTLLGETVLFVLQRRSALQSMAGQVMAPLDGSTR